jgi:hypothetical protein
LREHRHLGPEQALVLVELARRELDDRLELDRVLVAEVEEVVERLRLDNLRRLGHSDPVRESGQLDGGRQGDDVSVALGEGAVDRDEAEVGGPNAARDLADEQVGQVAGGGDDRAARLEVQDACFREDLRHAVREPDVAGPEEPLLLARTGSEKSHARTPNRRRAGTRDGPERRSAHDGVEAPLRRGAKGPGAG